MSMEHNELQISQGQQMPPTGAASESAEGAPAGSQNGQQQRRRRRRRKSGRATGTPESQAAGQAGSTDATAPESAQAHGQDRTADREPGREQSRDQVRESRESKDQRSTAAHDTNRDSRSEPRGRKGRNQQSQGKKQQRQAKAGGGAEQGRHFSRPPQPPRESNPGNGSGQPALGSARRKNKARRQAPSFVGPMDHSYRAVNGNIADGPPSTMDYRAHAGNGNGNLHSRSAYNGNSGYADTYELPPPVLLREDAPTRILCFIEDLFVVAKMQETARKLGVKVSFAKPEKDLVARLMDTPEAERPSLIVFDLNNVNAKPLTLIPKLKAKLKRATSVIGFLSHIQGDLKVKAIEAGCDMVMPKSAFSQNLPNLLRRHGLDEELEAAEA